MGGFMGNWEVSERRLCLRPGLEYRVYESAEEWRAIWCHYVDGKYICEPLSDRKYPTCEAGMAAVAVHIAERSLELGEQLEANHEVSSCR
jgi:hypothetical protein